LQILFRDRLYLPGLQHWCHLCCVLLTRLLLLQRKREAVSVSKAGSSKKPVDPAEAEALARREAARRRVEDRTKQAFGLT
jgi:hypothetical protein